MLIDGLPSPKIPADYGGWLLVLNEPNVEIQANLSPQEAARRLADLRQHYPVARLVCCGVSVWALDWMQAFMDSATVLPDAWHFHAYTEEWITPEVAQDFLTQMHDLTGGAYWITEYGSPQGRIEDFIAMTEWFERQPWVTRIAPYTNRQDPTAWYKIGVGVELVQDDGALTPIGDYYRYAVRQGRAAPAPASIKSNPHNALNAPLFW